MTIVAFLAGALMISIVGILHVLADLQVFKDQVGTLSKEALKLIGNNAQEKFDYVRKLRWVIIRYLFLLSMWMFSFNYQHNGAGTFFMGVLVMAAIPLAGHFFVAALRWYRVTYTTVRRTPNP